MLEDTYHLFFEVMPSGIRHADIGHATSTDGGCRWTYHGIVLDEPQHLAYPFVFEWQGEVYLLPDTQAAHLTLWRADPFPLAWKPHATFPKGDFKDPTLLRHGERWWLFSSPSNDVLELHGADALTGPWVAHPQNPIVDGDATIARPGGRPFRHDGRLFRVAQDDEASYGRSVRAIEITELSETTYEERSDEPIDLAIASGAGWNSDGMHHFDAHRLGDGSWIAAVDGRKQRYRIVWKRRHEMGR